MRICVTAGPTREYLDPVRFLTNASSGRMGCAIADAALRAGHQVRLLLGPVHVDPPPGAEVHRFTSVRDLKQLLDAHFDWCDALIMTAAVGDFRCDAPADRKLSRKAGPIELRLVPTEDVLAGVAARKRDDQTVVAFAVEDLPVDEARAKARRELAEKHADWVVLNTPAAMGAEASEACILSARTELLGWARRDKTALARAIVASLEDSR